MKKKHVVLASVLVAASMGLGGCASMGNASIAKENQQSISKKLVRGKTTESQVRAEFGDPMKTSFTDSGNSVWEYDYTKLHDKAVNFIPFANMVESGMKGKKKTLVMMFDKKQVLKNYTLSASAVDESAGLLP